MSIALIGLGNIIFKDDGVGIYATTFIEKNHEFTQEISIIDGGTLGFKLMDYMQEYKEIIIVDTITLADSAGSIYQVPSNELLQSTPYKQTVHEVEVLQVLQSCQFLENCANVEIIGIVADDIISVEIGLSNALKSNFEVLIETILKRLQKSNVLVSRSLNNYTLDEILNLFANPQNA